MEKNARLAILGTGSIGSAMALGLAGVGKFEPEELILTRRKLHLLDDLAARGFGTRADNRSAVRDADIVVITVEPHQLDGVLVEIAPDLDPERHIVVSVVSGATIRAIRERIGKDMPIVRAMPNTAIALGQSMTCLAFDSGEPGAHGTDDGASTVRDRVVEIFDAVGSTLVVDEEQIVPATALCACGVAFFLRAVRAASQGGIEIGFHPEEALTIAAQTALGAAALVIEKGLHPEREIDSVTTPRGCTIAGLNEMEHRGFSSAMIKGIVTSAGKAGSLYAGDDD